MGLFQCCKEKWSTNGRANNEALNPVITGEKSIVLAGVDYMTYAAKAKGEPVDLVYPSSGTVIQYVSNSYVQINSSLEEAGTIFGGNSFFILRKIILPLILKAVLSGFIMTFIIKEIVQPIDEDIIMCGHSHLPFARRLGKKIIFNPGSLGCPYDGKSSVSYGIININSSEISFYIKRVNYSTRALIAAAKRENFPYINNYENLILKGRKIITGLD